MTATEQTVKRAVRAAAKHQRDAYVVPTHFGPRIDWRPAAFGVACLRVTPDGTVETVAGSADQLPVVGA